MKPDWTLVANSTRARLLQQEPGSPMVILESFLHPARKPAAAQLPYERPAPIEYASSMKPVTGAHTEFARELAHLLEQEAQLDHFRSLTIFATEPFLQELQEQLGRATRRLLADVHEADLIGFTLGELEERIANELAPAR